MSTRAVGALPVHVLHVEDNPRHADLLRDEIEVEVPGSVVTGAASVAEARRALNDRRFDLVVLDFRLPDGDGLELLREMRGAGRGEPVVFVTTAASATTAVEAMKLGASDYVVKEEGYVEIVPFVVRDVLERVRLREERAELERRLRRAEQTAALHKLTAGMAHNLNNPLTTVRTFLELLPARWATDEEFRGGYYELVLSEVRRIRDLIGSMMRTVAACDTEEGEPWRADSLVRELEAWMAPVLADKSLRLESRVDDGLPALRRGREAVKQSLIVLLDNAVAFSPAGGTIGLVARHDPTGGAGERLVLEVSDRGPGVPEAERTRIFDPFYTTRSGGVGIGLFVANSLAQAHGGAIEVGDSPQGGAVFRVSLPASSGRDEASAPVTS